MNEEDWPRHLDLSEEDEGSPLVRYYRGDIVRGVVFLYSGLGVVAGVGLMALLHYLRS